MAATTEQIVAVRMKRPRIRLGDVIVVVAAIIAFSAGWAIKSWHDNRLRTAEVSGVTVAYPYNWIRVPSSQPVLLTAISNEDGRTRVLFSAVETPHVDALLAVATTNANPAAAETGFIQLGNRPATVDGRSAIATDYAYVSTALGGATAPTVIRGRQYAWIAKGRLYVFALEAPEDRWSDVQGRQSRMVNRIGTAT